KEDGDTLLVGLTDFAQSELGDIVFINMPFEGDKVRAGETFADVESVKAVGEILSPADGVVAEVNEALVDAPEMINQSPYDAWVIRIKEATNVEKLLTAEEYENLIKEG
ncbi:MAG: glycine cleavage system protein GcvH, partial [Clostridiales bacterium]|nr:glycine cleavage system protein GcvH [Clostridiales bacterium]